jgi:hypothetical protein
MIFNDRRVLENVGTWEAFEIIISINYRAHSPEYESFIKNRVEILAMDLGLEFLLSVWQQIHLDVRVTTPSDILHWKVLRLKYL